MAPPSPRRSSRARVPNSQSQQSSMSSGASGRHELSTRSLNKPPSDQSTPTASLSSEPPEDLEDTLLSRRRRRPHDDDSERVSRANHSDTANASDDMQDEEEDEAVRCLCGSEDYPGRPQVDGPDSEFFDTVELTDDVIGFFVQCDICKVWQHGACVGIFSAESSPDEYFCEQCRKDLHSIHIANNGQHYSKYLPLYRSSLPESRATSVLKDGSQSPKSTSRLSRAEAAAYASKRRSTMNSRDAAYDDEQLRRAIEASREAMPETEDGTARGAKRSRSDSEENQAIVKRQRTSSRSPSPVANSTLPPSADFSDEEASLLNAPRTSRSARSLRDRSDKEDKERQRQESALKRKGRAERRRAEDSDASDDGTSAPKLSIQKTVENVPDDPADAVTTPGTPPAAQSGAATSQKKALKPTLKRGKGRNQYTKEQHTSPSRSMSRDIQRAADEASSTSNPKSPSQGQKQGSKIKPSMANKMTLQDMKRRVAAIMDFISRTQLDLAAEAVDQSSSSNSGLSTPKQGAGHDTDLNGERNDNEPMHDTATSVTGDKDFKQLTCVEMMDVLTRDMVKWQNQYE